MLSINLKKVQQNAFIKNVVVILKGSVFVQLLCFALAPVLTRLYLPSDFGIYTLYFSLLSIASIVVALRFDIAIPIPKRQIEASYLVVLSIISTFFVSVLAFVLVFLCKDKIALKLGMPLLAEYLWILPFGLCMAGIYNTSIYLLVRKRRYGLIARAKIFQGLGLIITQLLGGILHLRPLGLIVGTFAGHLCAVMLILLRSNRPYRREFRHYSVAVLAKVARMYWKFPFFSSPASLINAFGMYMPAILMASLYGSKIAGWYGLVIQAVAAPLGLIGQAIGQVYVGQGAKLKQDGLPGQLKTVYLKTMLICFLVALPFILLLMTLGPSLFSIIFGQNWEQSGLYAQILGLMFLIEFTVVGPSQNFTLFERQDFSLLWNILFCGLIGLSFVPAFLNHAPSALTLLYLSIAKSVGYITMAGLNIYVLSSPQPTSVRCVE